MKGSEMSEDETQPLSLLGLDEDDTEDVIRVLSNSALIRAVLVAFLALLGSVVGREVGAEWLDPFIDLYTLTVAPALGWYLHRLTKQG